MQLTHLSLFSGIGGLDIAAEWAGFETVGQCEWADYPHKVLTNHWSDVPKWRDIRSLTGESFYEKTGLHRPTIISGGFPCQPFSTAGKRKGFDDDRYLWPEMLRVISEIRPAWIIGENVAGIVSMALDTVCADMENQGYEVQPFLIPACGVSAPHRRERVFIVGHAKHNGQPTATELRSDEASGNNRWSQEQDTAGQFEGASRPFDVSGVCGRADRSEPNVADTYDARNRTSECCADGNRSKNVERWAEQPQSRSGRCGDDVSHTASAGLQGQRGESEPLPRKGANKPTHCGEAPDLRNWKFESNLGRMADGIFAQLDSHWNLEPDTPRVTTGVKDRANRLKSLGNAVVPQQAYPIFYYIAAIERGVLE